MGRHLCMINMINTNAKDILGETSGGKYGERESWWWNDEVQKAVKEKRDVSRSGKAVEQQKTWLSTVKTERMPRKQ